MTKRVAWFTGEPNVKGRFTPYKVYEVFNEDGDSFNLKDDTGNIRFCLGNGCAHICHKDWVFADVVEEETIKREGVVPTKAKKWSKWIENTTGEQPEGLDEDVKVKLHWNDGDVTKSTVGSANWFFSESVNITHYKVKKNKWTKNTGVIPIDGDVKIEVKWRDGTKEKRIASCFVWSIDDEYCDIIKWRVVE